MIPTILVFTFVIALLVLLGIVFSLGKGSSLIAGYNTMPKEEQNQYDTIALCKFMGKLMFAVSFCMLLCLIGVVCKMNWLLYLGIGLSIGIVVFMLIYANTGNRFKKTDAID
ncbi:DUF3784 domain-containing protein [Virgibacillus sp. 179-BFC.A HS]|uniref:DUF3784 domain-containing protein n=1 Tax=Tigheibacillus jepli TaxID=3035914 RepID=A0ABU5CF35_9BACI|nr:DUF3784 domain-containing protein [Virgibacillus sp. 179-BFC.A HS]MDY0404825.1 DUF3784 domain-containing protein [Virgibacillus sp. 179-BFC.A HS]